MDKTLCKIVATVTLAGLSVLGSAEAIQPLDLNQAGSATTVQNLPKPVQVSNLVNTFAEGVKYTHPDVSPVWTPIDPANVCLTQQTDMRVWLVGGVADYVNQIGYTVGGDYSINTDDQKLIFRDASPTPDDIPFDNNFTQRTRVNGIGPGKLDFFLVADIEGAGTKELYWTDLAPGKPAVTSGQGANVNPDGLQHSLAFLHKNGNYILYAWEDLPQLGDMDYNDVFMLVKADGLCVPEPGTYMMLGTILSLAIYARQRREVEAAA